MTTFFDANQARLKLKMILSNYCWYKGSCIIMDKDENNFVILINVSDMSDNIFKIIPKLFDGFKTKIGLE